MKIILRILTAYLGIAIIACLISGIDISKAVSGLYDHTIRIVNSSGTVIGGTASATTASYDGTVRVVDSTGHVLDSFGGGSPGGTNGQIQYNNSSAFGGFTATGDA